MTNLKVGKDPTYTQLAFEQARKSKLKMFPKDPREENIPEIKQDKKTIDEKITSCPWEMVPDDNVDLSWLQLGIASRTSNQP